MAIKNKTIKNLLVASLVVSLVMPNVALAGSTELASNWVINEMSSMNNAYKVVSSKAIVRNGKSSKSKSICTLKENEVVNVSSMDKEWAKIECKGHVGFIKSSDINKINIDGGVSVEDELVVISENYKVVVNKVKVMKKASTKGATLGELKKGDIVKVTEQGKDFYKVTYNSKVGYVDKNALEYISSNVQSKYGRVIVRYIEAGSNIEISSSETYTKLSYNKNYKYTAKDIEGYEVAGKASKKIKLTPENSPYEVIFEYNKRVSSESVPSVPSESEKVLGNVTVNYIDKSTGNKIAESANYNNLEMGVHEYNAKTIEGYNVVGDSSVKVTLTKENVNQKIDFKYEKKVEDTNKPQEEVKPPAGNVETNKEVNINEVPYISTYYVKPIIKPGDSARLEYYVTDFNQKENREGKSDATFTVRVKIEGREDIVQTNVMPGDNTIDLGIFTTEGEQKFSIIATDQYGRSSHELFNYFLVRNDVEVKEYKMTEADLTKYNIKNSDNYENVIWVNVPSEGISNDKVIAAVEEASKQPVESKTYNSIRVAVDGKERRNSYWKLNKVVYAKDYDKEAVLAEAKATREGIQKLLDDKAAEGYNKVTLLEGVYRMDHEESIYIPTKMTVDMNQATLKLNQFTGDKAIMVKINNTFDSHLVNGIIEGDYFTHDYENSPNSSEWVMGVEIGGEAKYSSFENLVIRDITGYGGGNGIANGREGLINGYTTYTYAYPKGIQGFKLGDIDRKTGQEIESNERTVSDYLDIKSKRLAHDDTESAGYIQVGRYLGYQGNPCGTWNIIAHFYDKDKNYIESVDGYLYRRIGLPKDATYMRVTILSTATPTDLSAYYFRIPTHCAFKNVTFENCRAVGLAQAAMKDMLVEGCEFINSGQTLAKCAYDAEDGWDMMQDVTFRSLNFHDNPMNEFLTCAGHNFVVEDMVQGNVYIWERTNSFVYRDNYNSERGNVSLKVGNRARSGYYRTYNNEINGNISISDAGGLANGWSMVVRDNKINGRASNVYGVGKYVNCEIGSATNGVSTWDSALGEGEFENCYIYNKSGENQGGIYRDCKIENVKGNLHRQFDIQGGEIKNVVCNLGGYDPEIKIKDAKIKNLSVNFGYWHQGGVMNIDNCEIDNEDYLFRLPHYAMKKPITIKNSTFKTIGRDGMIFFYDDRTGGSAGEAGPQEALTIEGTTIDMSDSKYIVTGLKKDGNNHLNLVSKNNVFDRERISFCNPEGKECSVVKITDINTAENK